MSNNLQVKVDAGNGAILQIEQSDSDDSESESSDSETEDDGPSQR